MENNNISFFDDNGEEIIFEIVDQLEIDGYNYLLVVDEEDEATILKQSGESDAEITYSLLEDDAEFQRVTLLFMDNEDYDVEI